MTNINENRDTYCELENLKDLRKTFIDADTSLIYLKDENLKYVFVNKAFENFYNMKSSDIIGCDDYELSVKEFADIRRKSDLEVIKKKRTVVEEVRWDNKIFQTTKFQVQLLNGNFGIGAYIKDVTEEYNIKKQLQKANEIVKENEEKLKLILDSTYEGIYGIDMNGNCTFCNASCLKLLGYKRQDELIGKSMHFQFHHSNNDGTAIEASDCRIIKALKKNEGTHADDEVFCRSDGTRFDVEYFSYPQVRDGQVIGAVVTFMDITSRKITEKENIYLSYHDSLTGLYNRRFFEEELKRIDNKRNLPISIIMGDVNGLKLTNDVFGHAAGDMLLQKAAEVMVKACREDDIIARWGGDEYIIILPKTTIEEAEEIANRIMSTFSKENIKALKCSISLGCDTKKISSDDIYRIIEFAEEKMYSLKTLNRKSNSSKTMRSLISTFNENPRDREHAIKVSGICAKIGVAMNLTESELIRLKNAALLHDIGNIVIDERLLNKSHQYEYTDEELIELKQHAEVGYRILDSFEDTLELAKYVLNHHERWDGSGYPKGLKGVAVPKLARILALAEFYVELNEKSDQKGLCKETTKEEIKKSLDNKFDPDIIGIFMQICDDL